MKFRHIHIIFVLGLIALIKMVSCEPEDWMMTDCNECFSYKPDSADLIIYLTINSENDSVPLIFYRGKQEEGNIDWIYTATSDELRLYSEVDQLYTVKATYRSGEETIIAFDADRMTILNANEDCGYPCYLIKGGIFDLRLMK
ncbi:MAG: hypothetical protein JXR52_09040 [Bacteroidales bacterium]|nr:hypothetical protein [Bacteroidales bacterium]MBN2698959.1 hypothetical protein [Bacteroidales bacterium]